MSLSSYISASEEDNDNRSSSSNYSNESKSCDTFTTKKFEQKCGKAIHHKDATKFNLSNDSIEFPETSSLSSLIVDLSNHHMDNDDDDEDYNDDEGLSSENSCSTRFDTSSSDEGQQYDDENDDETISDSSASMADFGDDDDNEHCDDDDNQDSDNDDVNNEGGGSDDGKNSYDGSPDHTGGEKREQKNNSTVSAHEKITEIQNKAGIEHNDAQTNTRTNKEPLKVKARKLSCPELDCSHSCDNIKFVMSQETKQLVVTNIKVVSTQKDFLSRNTRPEVSHLNVKKDKKNITCHQKDLDNSVSYSTDSDHEAETLPVESVQEEDNHYVQESPRTQYMGSFTPKSETMKRTLSDNRKDHFEKHFQNNKIDHNHDSKNKSTGARTAHVDSSGSGITTALPEVWNPGTRPETGSTITTQPDLFSNNAKTEPSSFPPRENIEQRLSMLLTPKPKSSKLQLSRNRHSNRRGCSKKDQRNLIHRGKWTLGSAIGSGRFGTVHVGMNDVTGSLMAVKVLKMKFGEDDNDCSPSSDNDGQDYRDLEREIEVMKLLNHPNIVRYLGAEVDNSKSLLHIFQEWVPGGSLASLLRKFGPFGKRVICIYLRQILEGLEYLHDNHIIHRDVKGGNILVDDRGNVKLADFGASKKLSEIDGSLNGGLVLSMKGTPYFMAPEVYEEKYGRKADIWSVGGVIIQMATGQPPWKQLGFKNPMSLFLHIKGTSDPPPEVDPHIISPSLFSIVSQCFQRNPENRPKARQLLDDPFFKEIDDPDNDEDIINSPLSNTSNSCSSANLNSFDFNDPRSTIPCQTSKQNNRSNNNLNHDCMKSQLKHDHEKGKARNIHSMEQASSHMKNVSPLPKPPNRNCAISTVHSSSFSAHQRSRYAHIDISNTASSECTIPRLIHEDPHNLCISPMMSNDSNWPYWAKQRSSIPAFESFESQPESLSQNLILEKVAEPTAPRFAKCNESCASPASSMMENVNNRVPGSPANPFGRKKAKQVQLSRW
eukprot:CAMPEP_0194372086 /NCGR_PEP_ID=MMETSP0174-20130528/20384_1 /TAXON_ID=216777 /ORGANISM="Proboscia alata, Strain PI-D3" /LENGTH=996 /DNA_ID=CAMNT_0039150383 /DNA_START=634 /DNA_END=3621 /DNA_ORIENTATION=+